MSASVKVSNAWKYTKNIYVNVSSAWKTIFNMYTNVNGSWKPLYDYWYSIGDWSDCSVTCGGGTQTRNVVCYRSDYTNHSLNQIAVSDSFCSKAGVTKPSTSQACNTQSCGECVYYRPGRCDIYTPNTTWEDIKSLNWTLIDWKSTSCTIEDTIYSGTMVSQNGSITKNGYSYFRGSFQESIANGDGLFYQVCRQSI